MSNEQQQSAPTESAKAAPAVRLSSHMETLPAPIKTRVTVLQDLQKQHDELEAKFNEERAALIAKYEKMYEPLYSKRTEIVNGTEVDDVAKAAANEEANAEANEAGIIGVPDFWLIALKTNDVVASQITPKDEGALKYLIDIKSFYLDSPKGFRLEFYFKENPYFKNLKLTKTYHMVEEDEPILERALGTTIEWSPGKNLTQKLMKKKPKKGAKDATVIMKLRPCESFFTFFCPPRIPEDEDEIDQDEVEELQDLFEQDYDVGATIRDKIIPHAVSWYTGEALDGEDFEEDEDEDEDEDDEEDADEDDESDYEDDDNDDNEKTEAQAQSTPVEAGKCASESS